MTQIPNANTKLWSYGAATGASIAPDGTVLDKFSLDGYTLTMTKQTRILRRAMAKAKPFMARELVGCFTPSEILALIVAGARRADGDRKYLKAVREGAQADKKAGICNPNWFYFVMPA